MMLSEITVNLSPTLLTIIMTMFGLKKTTTIITQVLLMKMMMINMTLILLMKMMKMMSVKTHVTMSETSAM